MTTTQRMGPVEKLKTGIPGFDTIADGGLPRDRSTLIAGTAGSAKTVFAAQFLACGIEQSGETGVFVTFEDSPEDIRRNMLSFGWDFAAWEAEGKLLFVDASDRPEEKTEVVGSYDLGGLVARVENAVRKIGATRISLDSLNALFVRFTDEVVLRTELFQIVQSLKRLGVTVVFTGERRDDYGDITKRGTEEFIADNVIILRNILVDERRRRTIEILKFRGTRHERGEFPFTITDQGIIVLPLSAIELTQESSMVRVTSGIDELDTMCDGGFFRDSVILTSGATGTGKTLLVTQFMAGGFAEGDRALLFAFEESKQQLFRNARAWGMDFEKLEREGHLRVVTQYPHASPLEDHLVRMKQVISEFKPNRIAVDSLSALERISSLRGFREFVISLTSFLKTAGITSLFTSTTATLLGGGSVTEKHISTLTDSIILLRYIEVRGEMRRGITVLKMRGSTHDKAIREYTIDNDGMHIGTPFRNLTGVLSGRVIPHADTGAPHLDAGLSGSGNTGV
jgi:circadian clock protein KaiC